MKKFGINKKKKNTRKRLITFEQPGFIIDKFDVFLSHVPIINKLRKRFFLKKYLLAFFFSFAFSYTLFFEYSFNPKVSEGEMALNNVKSPFSFDIIDKESTDQQILKSENSVPPVFNYDSETQNKLSDKINLAFLEYRDKLAQVSSNPILTETQLNAFRMNYAEFKVKVNAPITEREFVWLIQNQFSAELESAIIKGIKNILFFYIVDEPYQHFSANQDQLLINDLNSTHENKQQLVSITSILDYSNEKRIIDAIKEKTNLEYQKQEDTNRFYSIIFKILKPNLSYNEQTTLEQREKAKSEIVPVVRSIKKNQTILSRGTIVTPYHIAILKEIKTKRDNKRSPFKILFMTFLIFMVSLIGIDYIRKHYPSQSNYFFDDTWTFSTISLFSILICKGSYFIFDLFLPQLGFMNLESTLPLLIPFATGTMMASLLCRSVGFYWLFTILLSLGLTTMLDSTLEYFIIIFFSSLVSGQFILNCTKRNDIYKAGLVGGVVASAITLFFFFIKAEHNYDALSTQLLFSFVGPVLSALFTLTFVPLLENFFDSSTELKLLELANLNHPLLQEMLKKAPGTYHHSVVVGSMVEAAALKIGANGLLGKVMSYFHDIGKMEHASYFIENQRPGSNSHDHISPYLSKTIILAHVKDGAELALKYNLGKPIVDGILQHHGTTLVSYFYKKAKSEADDPSTVNEEEFRYPGPKPQFKESALLMLADSIEATARSIDNPTPEKLNDLVDSTVERKFREGQLDKCDLTLSDLYNIKETFYHTLTGMYHHRISYNLNDDKESNNE